MKTTLVLGLLILGLCIAPAPALAGETPSDAASSEAAGSQLSTVPPSRGGGGPTGSLSYCEATCIGAANVSCQASSCYAQDSTCSTPGYVECNGVRSYCSDNTQPSVTVSCQDLFRKIDCTANVSGGTGSYSYSWTYQGPAAFWSESGNKAWAHFPPTGCTGSNSFGVTVTDTCGSDYDSENVYCSW